VEDTDDEKPLFTAEDDDDEPLFKGCEWIHSQEPLSTSPVLAAPSRKRVRREKCLPPSALDKATENIRQGEKSVSLIGTPIEPDMDWKLANLIKEVMHHPDVASVEMQASMISTFK
jgi:hypothetical protein